MQPVTVGPFALVERIGRGAMGEVWRGRHVEHGVDVALKVLSDIADPRGHASFADEVRAVASLRHPHILWVLDHGVVPPEARGLPAGAPYLVTELATRGSLRGWMGRGALTWPEIRAVALATLDALAHAHARGVIHRDLKAENILLTDDPAGIGLRLADFGIAHVQGGPVRAATAGTLSAMAPEQLRGDWRAFGPPTDLYALGCLLHRLVNGRAPFVGTHPEVALGHLEVPPPPLVLRDGIPGGLRPIVARLLRKSPGARYQRAADVSWALAQLPEAALARKTPDRGSVEAAVQLVAFDSTTVMVPAELPVVDEHPARVDEPAPVLPVVPSTWRARRPAASAVQLHGAGLRLFGLRAVPLVGREVERNALWEELRAAAVQTTPRVVVVEGAEGVGKRALARWLGERAHEVGAAITCVVRPSGDARDPLAAMLAAGLGAPGELPDDLRDDLGAWLADPSRTAPRVRRAIARRWLEHQAQRRLVLLVVEQAHTDHGVQELVAELATRGRGPLLVVVTRVAERNAPDALGDLATLELALDQLPPASVRALIDAMLPLSDDLASQLERRAGGDPLFVVQLVTSLVQGGRLRPARQGAVLEGPLVAPADLSEAWRARLEAVAGPLDAEPVVPLLAAAVKGTSVARAEWEAVCAILGVDPGHAVLQALIDGGLVASGADGWAWSHPMLRECLVDEARRRGVFEALHGAWAEVVPQGPGRGRHLALARRHRDAVEAFFQSKVVGDGAEDHADHLVLLGLLEDSLDALEVPGSHPWRIKALVHRAHAATSRGHLGQAFALAEEAIARAETHGLDALAADAQSCMASIERMSGRVSSARARLEALLATPERLGARYPLLCLHYTLVLVDLGRAEEAWAVVEPLLSQELTPSRAATARLAAGRARLNCGALDEGCALIRDARDAFRELGDVESVANCDLLLGTRAMVDRRDEAERHLLDALAGYRRVGALTEVSVRINLAALWVSEARFVEALPELEGAVDTLVRTRRPGLLSATLYVLCHCHARLDQWEAVPAVLERACALSRETGLVEASSLYHLNEIGLAARDAGRLAVARRAFVQAIDMAERLGMGPQRDEIAAGLATVPDDG